MLRHIELLDLKIHHNFAVCESTCLLPYKQGVGFQFFLLQQDCQEHPFVMSCVRVQALRSGMTWLQNLYIFNLTVIAKLLIMVLYRINSHSFMSNGVRLKSSMCLVAQLCPTVCSPMGRGAWQATVHGDPPGKNTGVGCHIFFQGIFPTQGLNPGLPHYRRILYHLSCQ